MKNLQKLVVVVLCLFYNQIVLGLNPINIKNAANKKLITVTLKSNGGHIGKCVNFSIKNNTKNTINVLIDAGRKLICNDRDKQNMVVTKNVYVSILPNKSVNTNVYAMCAEASDGSPGRENSFNLGDANDAKLVGLASLIGKYNYQNSCGQAAVWCITDNKKQESIYDNDTVAANKLRRYVAKVKQEEFVPYFLNNDKIENQNVGSTHNAKKLYVGFTLSTQKNVTIQIRDRQNNVVKIFLSNYPFSVGAHSKEVTFYKQTDAVSNYLLEILADNEPVLRRSFVY